MRSTTLFPLSAFVTLAAALTAAAILAAPVCAGAAENAGNVIAARRQAWAERGPQQDPLASKSPVFTGDTLATNPIGRLQVLFRDDSVLMMAPDTRTTVTEYVYGEGKKPAFGLKLAQGVTRLISGRITEADPEAMRVETSHAVVGIKGTDVRIAAHGAGTKIALIHGTGKAVEVFSKIHGATFFLTESGTALTLTQGDTSTPRPVREPMDMLADTALPLGDSGQDTADSGTQQDSSTAESGAREDSSTADSGAKAGQSDTTAQAQADTGRTPDGDGRTDSAPPSIVDNVVVDTASDQSIAQPTQPVTPEPESRPSFSGTYQGALAGAVSGSQVSGSFTMGVKDIAEAPTVSGVSLYVSSDSASSRAGTSGSSQQLSIYGEGDIATLNSDGSFQFRSDKDSQAKLQSNNLLSGGYVDVSGATDGSGISLGLTGNLGEDGADVGISGDGSKISDLPPALLPSVPSISPSFSGRYAGALSGTVAGTAVSGNIYMGVKNIAAAPTVSAVSAYVSEKGWAGNAANALSIYGEGTIAALNADGTFRFTSTSGSQAKLEAGNMLDSGYVTVNGKTDGNGMTIGMTGSLGGETADVSLSGPDVPKVSANTPGLGDLPAPPSISPSFSGRYSGNIAGTVAGAQVSGQFHMGVKDIAAAPTVSAVSAYVSEKGWADGAKRALSIYGDGTIATLNADGTFRFTSTASSDARLSATGLAGNGYVTVNGAASGNEVTVSAVGSLDGSAANIALEGDLTKTSVTTPGLGDLPTPPSVRPAFNGRYSGALAGTIGGTQVSGQYHLGIKDLANAPTVNAVSLFASEKGWAEGARKPLSIYGSGTIATLNSDGSFSFNANESSPARLAGGTAAVTGQTDGDTMNLGVIGSLDGDGGMHVSVNGGGALVSTTPPSLSDLPAPPSTATRFNGRYSGALSGGISNTPVTGEFHMGVKNLGETPMVSAVSLYASDMGWNSAGGSQALSIQGEGNLAALNSSGGFTFNAQGWGTDARLRADGLAYSYSPFGFGYATPGQYTGGSVTVSGTAASDGINLGLIGSLDGVTNDIIINGSGDLVSTTPPSLNVLPTPPSIASSLAGVYMGTLAGTVDNAAVNGTFAIGVRNISSAPTISGVHFALPGATSYLHGGTFNPINSDGSFAFNLDTVYQVQGHVANDDMNLNWNYSNYGKTGSGTGSGTKVSTVTW